jgi:hypothetical protein
MTLKTSGEGLDLYDLSMENCCIYRYTPEIMYFKGALCLISTQRMIPRAQLV